MEEIEAFKGIVGAIRNLQAAQIAQTRVLRALIASHPDPDAMREAWRRYSSGSIADASLAKTTDPERLAVHEAMAEALQAWDARLEQDLPGASSRQG